MNAQPKSDCIGVEEYITGEQESDIRHEYIGGMVHAMSGASANHNLITGNLFALMHGAARQTSCQVFIADMKVYLDIAGRDIFYYPDVLVSCDPDDQETYFRKHPCLIVEVLSKTTERIDRQEKFLAYTSIDSLQEYILISQEQAEVTLFRRTNKWLPELFASDDKLHFDCLNCDLSVDQIYENINL